MSKAKLSPSMTVGEFENGYWYARELKIFAEELGLPSAGKLRKDELETAITRFLKGGKLELPTKRNLSKAGPRDLEHGLSLDLPVINYTSNDETRAFIEREAKLIAPNLKRKSGARYRLNRWREEQLTKGRPITYRDIVVEYVRLSEIDEPFERIPQVRYINFLAEFLEAEKGSTREAGIRAWKQVKKMDCPKTYEAWKAAQSSQVGR